MYLLINNFDSQGFLEPCRYVVKERKIPKYSIDDFDSDREKFSKKNSNEENFDEEN